MTDRIAEIIEKEKLSSLKFATMIGIQPSAVSHFLSGRNKPSTEVVTKILNTFRTISSDWLLLGVGPMYRETGETSKKQPVEVKITPNTPQMASLFEDETENDTEYHKENATNTTQNFQSSQNHQPSTTSERQQQTTSTNPEIKHSKPENIMSSPKRVVKKIIIYYSDNIFEEYLLKKED